jgi:hypothetical protein
MVMHEIMVTQYTDRKLRALLAVSTFCRQMELPTITSLSSGVVIFLKKN